MPRGFTEEERRAIREQLLDAAEEHFGRYGYRKANVADIARQAGISKGSLYLFFDAKGELFAEVALRIESRMRQELRQKMQRRFRSPLERLESFFRAHLEALGDHPVMWIMLEPEEASAVFRDISPESRARMMREDLSYFEEFLEEWREKGWIVDIDSELLTALARSLYAMNLHKDLVGRERYAEVADLLVESLARRLCPDPPTGKDDAGLPDEHRSE